MINQECTALQVTRSADLVNLVFTGHIFSYIYPDVLYTGLPC